MNARTFIEAFGLKAESCGYAPARVNLIGEWVDFNGGMVLPAALPVGVRVEIRAGQAQDAIVSNQFDGIARFDPDHPRAGHWSDYVRGALQCARRQGWIAGGCEVAVQSDMPAGAGLSSSAAVIVATLLAAHGDATDAQRADIAVLARAVENDFIGVPCGIMDQMAVALAGPGEALALDTRDLTYARYSIPRAWRFCVVHSGEDRALADGAYAERRLACQAACDALGVTDLCGLPIDQVEALPDALRPVARHVVGEDVRAREAVAALQSGDADQFGALMDASHQSLRDDFGVSTPGIDALVQTARRKGALGARLTGAGFGGCIVALMRADHVDDWWSAVSARHPQAWRVSLAGEAPA